MLRESLKDYERMKRVLWHTVATIVQAERQREQALKEQKLKMDKEA